MDQSPTLSEQLFAASLILLDRFGEQPELDEFQVRQFMHSQPFCDFFYTEILRIALTQNYMPEEEHELAALNGYANVMAAIMLRVISTADYAQNNYAIEVRQN